MQKPILQIGKWNYTRPLFLLAACCTPVSLLAQVDMVPHRAPETLPTLDNPASAWGPNYTNWIELGVGGLIVQDGNKASAQRRLQVPASAFGGIESFHWEAPIDKDWMLQTDARAIFNNDDYDLKVGVVNPKQGYLRVGYREYRTWYDRIGGYNSFGPTWLTPFEESVHVDRGAAYIEGGFTVPNAPKITFSYSHEFRDGTKDSTAWGDKTVPTTPPSIRKIVPSFWELDEKRDIFRADLSHSIGNTGFDVGFRYERDSQDNELKILRNAAEANQRAVTQQNNVDSDFFSGHASTQTRINDNLLFSTGYSYTHIDADVSGHRFYGPDFDPAFDLVAYGASPLRSPFDEGFTALSGTTTLKQHVGNLNLMITPWENVSILPILRIDSWTQDGNSIHTDYNIALDRTLIGPDTFNDRSDQSLLDVTEALEARYTGLPNWSFYARGDWTEGQGDLKEFRTPGETAPTDLLRDRNNEHLTQKYTAGANWYPWQRLNFGGQYYHKIRYESYDHSAEQVEDPLILQQLFNTDDVNFRVNYRPFANLSFITRYDFQFSTIDSTTPFYHIGTATVDNLPGGKLETANITSHIISETVTWSPLAKLYLQASFSYAIDNADTPADVSTVTAARGPVVFQSENGYWNFSGLAGYALDERTDVQLQYYFYKANNYNDVSAATQPYNSGAEQQGVTATLMHQFSRALRWTMKYGFFTSHDRLYGSHTDYNAHLVYSTIQYRF